MQKRCRKGVNDGIGMQDGHERNGTAVDGIDLALTTWLQANDSFPIQLVRKKRHLLLS
jgi:hypothetical protein